MTTDPRAPRDGVTPVPSGPTPIDRREVLRRVTLMLGGMALVGGGSLWTAACTTADADRAQGPIGEFTSDDIALLDEIAETILPATGTPGAKAARVGAFMALMVTDTYPPEQRALFRKGMVSIDDASRLEHGHGFRDATVEERLTIIEAEDQAQYAFMRKKEPSQPPHFFRMMKELALLGFFTSEIGYTQVMRYEETPGRFDPCVPYTPGATIWADHA
jgi:hypothetical protein